MRKVTRNNLDSRLFDLAIDLGWECGTPNRNVSKCAALREEYERAKGAANPEARKVMHEVLVACTSSVRRLHAGAGWRAYPSRQAQAASSISPTA